MPEAKEDAPSILTAAEAAARLRISRSKLYELLDAGKIPHHRIGEGRRCIIRIKAAALDAYFESTSVVEAKPEAKPEVRSALRHFRPPAGPARPRL